jgi:hypothetical protein
VSLYPCSSCHERVPGKLSQVYWAWLRSDGTRGAWRQRLCAQCFGTNVYVPAVSAMTELVSCPVCHAGTADDMDPVYATIYTPGQPRIDVEMALCGPCAVEIRNRALLGAEALPDRQGEVGGSSPPQVSAADTWAALGLTPNGRGPEHPEP